MYLPDDSPILFPSVSHRILLYFPLVCHRHFKWRDTNPDVKDRRSRGDETLGVTAIIVWRGQRDIKGPPDPFWLFVHISSIALSPYCTLRDSHLA
jgi:hypothetical protein